MRKQDDTTEAAAEWLPIESLSPWADNPRSNAHAVPEVAKSIKRFGFASPIIARPIDGGGLEIVAGHTRHKAAQSLGLDRVPVRVMDLDPADAKLLALADNRLGELADWTGGLEDILRELDADGVDLDGLGWSPDDLAEMISEDDRRVAVPDVTFSEVIGESNHYVVLRFESDIDWLQAQSVLDLQTVTSKRANGKPWSSGIGRVLDGPKTIAKLTGAD